MAFEWDEAKRLANIQKHGVDFVDVEQVFAGEFIETDDLRREAVPCRRSIGQPYCPDRIHMARRPSPDYQRQKGRTR